MADYPVYIANCCEKISKREYVYVLKSGDLYKIGRTTKLSDRLKTLAIQLPFRVEFYLAHEVEDSGYMERILHNHFAKQRMNGEWFRLTDEQVGEILPRIEEFSFYYHLDEHEHAFDEAEECA